MPISRKPFATIRLLIIALLLLIAWLGLRDRDRPVLKGNFAAGSDEVFVDDTADLLSLEQRERIAAYQTAILDAYDIDFRVATIPGDFDLNMEAARRFADRRIGAQSSTGRGLLLLIAPDMDQVRIEVGRGLEPVFTDAFVAYIEHRQMTPYFEGNRVADGVLATTELVADRAGLGAKTAAFADPADGMAEPSTGAGARAEARIGAGYSSPTSPSTGVTSRGSDPAGVVATYLNVMATGNANPDLDIYTTETREMMRSWVVTPAQMTMISRTYRACAHSVVRQAADHAVVRFAAGERTCAPFFLSWSEDLWQIDLTVMSSSIRFNHKNQWYFPAGPPRDYSFAFEDWRFDQSGFPHENINQK